MFIVDFGSALGTVFILVCFYYSQTGLWFMYFGIILSSIFSALQEPAYKATVTDLLSKDQYDKASGLMQLANSSQYLISPFIASILLSYFSINMIFIIDISTFVLAIISILWVRNNIGEIHLQQKKDQFFGKPKRGHRRISKTKRSFIFNDSYHAGPVLRRIITFINGSHAVIID